MPSTEIEEALSIYEEDGQWALYSREPFNGSRGRLFARYHTEMAETYQTGSKQNLRD